MVMAGDATGVLALLDQADLAIHRGDLAAARALADEAWEHADGEAPLRGRAQTMRARCDYVTGDFVSALSLVLDAVSQCRRLADAEGEAIARALSARILLAAGDATAALEAATAALQVAHGAGADPDAAPSRALLASLTAAGVVHLSLEQLDDALDYCSQALRCAETLGDETVRGAATDTLACVYGAYAARERDAGDTARATQFERQAMQCSAAAVQIARDCGHVEYEATALANQAESLCLLGEPEQALALLEAWAQRYGAGVPTAQAHHLDTRGTICMTLGRPAHARELFEQALPLTGYKGMVMLLNEHLAQACEACGDFAAALTHHKRFHALHVELTAESAQRSARVAAVRLETTQAQARAEGLARHNALLHRRAEDLMRQSLQDPLTGLPNRRRMEQLLKSGADRFDVALVDVDHFKRVNDQFSHAIGDAVLRRLGSLLQNSCRSDDTPVRLGGEEFVILMPALGPIAARAAAERLRSLVQAGDWAAVAPALAVTVSIGVACAGEAESADALLNLADQRLYAAKAAGRNCVVSS